jgi:predicted ester cyclase
MADEKKKIETHAKQRRDFIKKSANVAPAVGLLLQAGMGLAYAQTDRGGGKPTESIEIVLRFWRELWNPPYNLAVIDELLSEDFVFVSAGTEIASRAAFKDWTLKFKSIFEDGRFNVLDIFSNPDGTKVVGRWKSSGRNNGLFGLPPDDQTVELTGISIIEVRGGRLVRHWAERSACWGQANADEDFLNQ